jgi:hypothetical protein
MSILTAENLSLSFGPFDLFGGISLNIARDSKIGLIGPNASARPHCYYAGRHPRAHHRAVHMARGIRRATCARRQWKPSPPARTPSTPRC